MRKIHLPMSMKKSFCSFVFCFSIWLKSHVFISSNIACHRSSTHWPSLPTAGVQRLMTQTMFWHGEIPVRLHQFMSEWIVQEFFTHILLWVISRCRALKKLEVLLIPMLVPMVPIAMSCIVLIVVVVW